MTHDIACLAIIRNGLEGKVYILDLTSFDASINRIAGCYWCQIISNLLLKALLEIQIITTQADNGDLLLARLFIVSKTK